jgi:3-hydroxyisobutyrate dehydrogenase-like beta-hydroxyacid dehydrogenase
MLESFRKGQNTMKKIGFIGLGSMGLPMALNLCKAGYEVLVCSGNKESEQRILDAGGIRVPSFKDMAFQSEVLITIVPADKEIVELYLSDDGILDNAKDGLICIDMTSAKGSTKQMVADDIAKKSRKVRFADAPVSGGVTGAESGTLTIMVGCEKELYDDMTEVLSAMGKKLIHTGEVGSASNIKMLNQMLGAANTAIVCEVLNISRQLGVDDNIMYDVIKDSSGSSFVFNNYMPTRHIPGDYTASFKLALMNKDVGIFADTASELKGFMPISNMVSQVYQAMVNRGHGDMDFNIIYDWFKENQK